MVNDARSSQSLFSAPRMEMEPRSVPFVSVRWSSLVPPLSLMVQRKEGSVGEVASPLASRMAGDLRVWASSWFFENEGSALAMVLARMSMVGIFLNWLM